MKTVSVECRRRRHDTHANSATEIRLFGNARIIGNSCKRIRDGNSHRSRVACAIGRRADAQLLEIQVAGVCLNGCLNAVCVQRVSFIDASVYCAVAGAIADGDRIIENAAKIDGAHEEEAEQRQEQSELDGGRSATVSPGLKWR
jgi:hypothetical protein